MSKRELSCFALVMILLLGAWAVKSMRHRIMMSRLPEPVPVIIPTHRQPIPNGFLLMFDDPITEDENRLDVKMENDGQSFTISKAEDDGVSLSILGIGRVKVPLLKERSDSGPYPGGTSNESYYLKSSERMVILVKLKGENCLFGGLGDRRFFDGPVADWRGNAFYGARSLQLPIDAFRSYFKENTGVRVEAIISRLPPKNQQILNDKVSRAYVENYGRFLEPIFLDIATVRLDQKPYLGPVIIDELQKKNVQIGDNRIRLYDWLIDNPALVGYVWEGGTHCKIPKHMQDHKYLSLRFLYARSSDEELSGFYAVVHGSKGEKILLEILNHYGLDDSLTTSNVESLGPWLGMEFSLDSNYREHRHDVRKVDPSGPAARAGIHSQDRIIETDEEASPSRCIDNRLHQSLKIGVPIKLNVSKAGTIRQVTITPVERPEDNPSVKGVERSREAIFEELVENIPHSGDASTGIQMTGEGKLGCIRLISCDPVPADFKPVKVSLHTFYPFGRNSRRTTKKPTAISSHRLELPEITIPPEFWK